jgi:hypothetical protein
MKVKRNRTNQCYSGAVLEAGGSSLAKAVKVNVFLANMDDFAAVNEVYTKFFPDPKPVSIFHGYTQARREVTVLTKIRFAHVLLSRLCLSTLM